MKFAYRVCRSGVNDPIVGGTCEADSMEDAVIEVVKRHKLALRFNGSVNTVRTAVIEDYDWMYKGDKVNLVVWAPPEHFADVRGISRDWEQTSE